MADPATLAEFAGAFGAGGVIQAGIGWLANRKKTASEAHKIDADTQLAYLTTVIERLNEENKRGQERDRRNAQELAAEQARSAKLRARVRELEDEIDAVRKSARDMQAKCNDLANQLNALLDDVQE